MARAMWSGSISFGLLNVPVKLYSAVARRSIALREIRESDSARIKHRRVAEGTDEEVPYEEIIKAFEITPGQYVPISKEEMSSLAPEKTRAIDVVDFVDLDQIDPIYFDSPYYLGPADGAEKAYSLLAKAMEASGKVAISRFVFRNKEHLAAIRTSGGVLTLTTMRFADEVVPLSELKEVLPEQAPKVAKREQEMAEQLIESLSTDFDPGGLPRRVPRAVAGPDRTQGRRQGDRRVEVGGAAGDQGARPDGGAGGEHRRGHGEEAGGEETQSASGETGKSGEEKTVVALQSEVLEVTRGLEPPGRGRRA